MKYLTVDFGSTYTKLVAIDSSVAKVVGTASAFTTIETDVMHGFNSALNNLKNQIGNFCYDELLCCSSAAGGLKMVSLGLVPELTAKAAKLAAASAGAKVIKTYSYEISKSEQKEIFEINPDLVLLCGGTDGGNKEVIVSNAKRLCEINRDFSIIVAGNKTASYELEDIFNNSNKDYVITENVMPYFNKLNITPARQSIKNLFIKKIVEAKGLSKIQEISKREIIPTPLAVMMGCELFSCGTKQSEGIGEFVAVDLGGATTDVYSMAKGEPSIPNVVEKGLPEPFNKRTVEGDLGMRYSLSSLLEELDIELLSTQIEVPVSSINSWVERCIKNPSAIAKEFSQEAIIEENLAKCAIEIAVERHCGTLDSTYTPIGEVYALTGKDLSNISYIVGIGGAIINSKNPVNILEGVKYSQKKYNFMKPKSPQYLLDAKYIFASMGLLSTIEPELALDIMKKEIIQI